MMKNPHPAQGRFYVLIAALGLMMLLFLAALYNAQILNGSENRARSIASNATWQTVEASRGILTDTNGKVLVSNRLRQGRRGAERRHLAADRPVPGDGYRLGGHSAHLPEFSVSVPVLPG